MKKRKLADIASEIDKHLKRFEADPQINKTDKYGSRFFWARSGASGRYVYVTYVSYQGDTHLSREEAEKYLEKLNEGFIGRHFEALL